MLWFAIFLALLYLPTNHCGTATENITNVIPMRKHHNHVKPFTAFMRDREKVTKDKKQKHKKHKATPEDKPVSRSIIKDDLDAGLYVSPHLVRDDVKFKKYAVHLFKRTMKLFDNVRERTDNRKVVDFVAEAYKNKLTEFLDVTQNQKIKTSLGNQKVIMNMLDTSNLILRRCLDYLIKHTKETFVLRADELSTSSIVKNEIEKALEQEYRYVCEEHGICRSGYGFLDFLSEVTNELLKNNDRKLKTAAGSLTEALKNTEFKKVLDVDLQHSYRVALNRVDTWSDQMLRTTLQVFRNMLNMRNLPFQVPEFMKTAEVNRAVALMDILDTMHRILPASPYNMRQWENIKEAVRDYTEGERHDIQRIMEAFVKHTLDSGINGLDVVTASKLKEKLRVLLS